MRKVFNLLILCSLLSSCKVLTKSESKAVAAYATGIAGISSAPVKIRTGVAEWNAQNDQMVLATISDPDFANTFQYANEIAERLADDDSITARIDTAYRVMEKVGQALLLLTDESYLKTFGGKADTLQMTGDSLISKYNTVTGKTSIPVSVGSLIFTVFKAAGQYNIHRLQRKYLINAINVLTPVLVQLADDYHNILSTKKSDIDKLHAESRRLSTRWYQYRDSMELKDRYMIPFINTFYNSTLLTWIVRERGILDLMNKTDTAMEKLKINTQALQKELTGPLSIKALEAIVGDFLKSAQAVANAYSKYQTELKKASTK